MSKLDETRGAEEKTDLFHHGVISKLFPSNDMGVVRTESGRDIPFSFQFIILLGEVKNPGDLKEGQEVGYDLGWTPSGLRVTKIKTYPHPLTGEGGSDLEGKGGQGQDFSS